jgi:cobalt/nickel transport protein
VRFKRAWVTIFVLLLVSPLFGVILAEIVGYHEPLDVAAELLGKKDLTEEVNWTPFLDYTIPWLPAEIGYIVSGFIGVAVIMFIGFLAKKASARARAS